ncbi:MAG TPA: hypothetical protein VES65_01675, partial [Solirubrobacteraceae bacterium]|nr:hypothetical protein [Solirubrobacteraceae bacterium]
TAPKETLCVYTEFEHLELIAFEAIIKGSGFGPTGTYIIFKAEGVSTGAPGQVIVEGTWAVTAP